VVGVGGGGSDLSSSSFNCSSSLGDEAIFVPGR
jgi:hypothetical protein